MGGAEDCGVMLDLLDFDWADYTCSQQQAFLCENVTPEPEPAPAPARPVPTYSYFENRVSFHDASSTCTAKGGVLATIRTAEEQAAAKAVVSAEDVPANQVRRVHAHARSSSPFSLSEAGGGWPGWRRTLATDAHLRLAHVAVVAGERLDRSHSRGPRRLGVDRRLARLVQQLGRRRAEQLWRQ